MNMTTSKKSMQISTFRKTSWRKWQPPQQGDMRSTLVPRRTGRANLIRMIAFLTGRLACKTPTHLTLDVQGVGYEVFIPLSTYYGFPIWRRHGAEYPHASARGCHSAVWVSRRKRKDRVPFAYEVSGIGPKLALSILSSLSVTDLVVAIQSEDVDKLSTVPGIGKKSAARIALELKDKVSKIDAPGVPFAVRDNTEASGPFEDALSALVNLGYRPQDAKDALKRISNGAGSPVALKDLIREGLKELARG